MSEVVTLSAETRDRAGKGGARATRRDGLVPGVIYGAKKAPLSIAVNPRALWRGHEFHYATVVDGGGDDAFAQVRDAQGGEPVMAGSRRGQVSGSFFHAVAPAWL